MILTRINRAREVTLALVKPSVTASPTSICQIFRRVASWDGVNILAAKKFEMTRPMTEKFYGEHKGRFYYSRLEGYIESGPVIGLALEGDDMIQKWRTAIGNTKVSRVKYSSPEALRHDFGVSDTRNGFHGSDAPETALNELGIIFPGIDFENCSLHDFNIDNIAVRSGDNMKITDPVFPPVDEEMTENAFDALNSAGNQLSSETFWDQYHEKNKRDWFMDYNTVATYLEEHTDIKNPDRSNKLAILDLGCGTSTLASMMLFKYKNLDLTLVDFSEPACKFQDKVINTLMSNMEKKTGNDLLKSSNSSIIIAQQDARSLSKPDKSVDIILDKGTMDAFSRLSEVDCYQAMDELARILKDGGVLIQITEQPPEIRQELWFKWSRTVPYEINVKQEKLKEKYVYQVTFSETEVKN